MKPYPWHQLSVKEAAIRSGNVGLVRAEKGAAACTGYFQNKEKFLNKVFEEKTNINRI